MSVALPDLDASLPTGSWTFYFHAPREKRWTIDTFKKIVTISTLRQALALFTEMGDKLKRGMYFCMRDPHPPLWENYQNIRGGSYSLRGGAEEGVEYYKLYMLGAMLGLVAREDGDFINGISISPKIMMTGGGSPKVGFYVIKVWNKDCEKFCSPAGLELLHGKLQLGDVLYTPHVEKKM